LSAATEVVLYRDEACLAILGRLCLLLPKLGWTAAFLVDVGGGRGGGGDDIPPTSIRPPSSPITETTGEVVLVVLGTHSSPPDAARRDADVDDDDDSAERWEEGRSLTAPSSMARAPVRMTTFPRLCAVLPLGGLAVVWKTAGGDSSSFISFHVLCLLGRWGARGVIVCTMWYVLGQYVRT
jgi:hypothetical protein